MHRPNPGSRVALLYGKCLRIRNFLECIIWILGLKPPIFSWHNEGYLDKIKSFMSLIWYDDIVSGELCLESLWTVWILSGLLEYSPDGFNTVQAVSTLSVLSRQFWQCQDFKSACYWTSSFLSKFIGFTCLNEIAAHNLPVWLIYTFHSKKWHSNSLDLKKPTKQVQMVEKYN